jgi:hypothetical protein
VRFKNTSEDVITLVLRNLVLESHDNRTFETVNVRSHAEFPPNFLDEKMKLPPGAEWRGFITFDGRVKGVIPESISYIDRGLRTQGGRCIWATPRQPPAGAR